MSLYSCLRPGLFKLDPELAHRLALSALSYLPSGCLRKVQPPLHRIKAMGLEFPHAVGLAAGLDKNGSYLCALNKLGFASIEIGTTTPKPQAGNPCPRLFRIPKAQALINRMGFNNKGVDALVANVIRANYSGILGINIGKNKDTSLNGAVEDYLYCLKKVYAYASYITINVSSPNTQDLRQLQDAAYFSTLLNQLREEQLRLADQHHRYVPLVVKLSPDETDDALKRLAATTLASGFAGIIATNTTLNHQAVSAFEHGEETGGVSGQPLQSRSTQCLRILKAEVGEAMTLIGVGGIDSIESARQKCAAGATLLQIYTGLIYQGPQLISQLVKGLNC